MAELFLNVLGTSVRTSYLIIFVVVVRFLCRKTQKSWICLLWMLVAVRLICLRSFGVEIKAVPNQVIGQKTPVTGMMEAIDKAAISGDDLKEWVFDSDTFWLIPSWIWAIGVLLLGLYCIVRYLSVYLDMREGVHLKENIWLCDRVSVPFVMGFLKPRIYLPSDVKEEEMSYIILHEQMHLSRKDTWWSAIGMGITILYWFNPLVWFSYYMFCNDLEFACDAKAVQNKDLKYRKMYAGVLLNYSVDQQKRMHFVPLLVNKQVKKRIRAILEEKKLSHFSGMVLVFMFILAAVLSFVTIGYKAEVNQTDYLKINNYFMEKNSAFAVTMDSDGTYVFEDPEQAFVVLCSEYKEGISLIRNEFELEPLTENNYIAYKNLGDQVTTGSQNEREQAYFVSVFLDIYENSF